MSKEIGFVDSAAEPSFVPTAPPSYEEAVQQTAGAYPQLPGPYHAQPMPMPLPAQQPPPMNQFTTPQPPAPVVNVTHPTLVFTNLGPDSSCTVCPKCHAQVMTRTRKEYKGIAHLCCCILLPTCCFCCLPYCFDSCKIVHHKCPNCHAKLGTYRP